MRRIHKFGLIVIRDNKVLLCRPHAFPDLITPGGIKEGDEDHVTNLLRETVEELGNDSQLDVGSLRYLGKFEDLAAGRTDVIVEIDLYIGDLKGALIASSEIESLIWYGLGDEVGPLSAVVKNKIIPFLLDSKLLK